jgi:hypothetical protein
MGAEHDGAGALAEPRDREALEPEQLEERRHMVTEQDVRGVLAKPRDREAALERVQTILERALNHRQCVRVLHDDLDVPDEIIAAIAGVVAGSVRRWRSSDPEVAEPRLTQAQAIERLRTIVLVLVRSGTFFDLRGVGVWLQTRREHLKWKAPYEILTDPDGFDRVLREAELFVRPGVGSAATPAAFGPPTPAVGPASNHTSRRK